MVFGMASEDRQFCDAGVLTLDPPPLGERKCMVLQKKQWFWDGKCGPVILSGGGLDLRSTSIRRTKMYGFASEKQWFWDGK